MIVEDDAVISKAIKTHMETWNYKACSVSDFKSVMEEFVSFNPQLVLMDISLPFYNGYHWCSEIRKISKVPVIFLSSASDNMNIVMAVNMGGDDFIPKPFDIHVLMAKIQAVLRRAYDFSGQTDLLAHKSVILNNSEMSLSYNDQKIALTKNDHKILAVLMERCGTVVSRDTLMERLWETDSFIDDNTLTVSVTRLRKKLAGIGLTDFIKTRKGTGYIIE